MRRMRGRSPVLRVLALLGRGAEDGDLGAERDAQLDRHVTEPAEPDHAEAMARAPDGR